MKLSTHVLDIGDGVPAASLAVVLEQFEEGQWITLDAQETDQSGRVSHFKTSQVALTSRVYKLRFETGAYFEAHRRETLYPFVEVIFNGIQSESYHIPLIVSNYGYSTYRGA